MLRITKVSLICVLICIVYCISPVDLYPGPIDDIIVTVVLLLGVELYSFFDY